VFKDKSDPIAKADNEYPEWLWTLLDGDKIVVGAEMPRPEATEMQGGFDFAKEKNRMRGV
jgi:hypothetical protein